jgi:hypothetical protein
MPSYKSAILAAIEELKDHETGSPAAAIRRCMQETSNNFWFTAAQDDTTITPAAANSGVGGSWNEALFQTTLKSLLSKDILIQVNGSNYKFTEGYLKRRAERLRAQIDSIEEERHHHRQQQQQQHHHSSSLSSATAAAASLPSISNPLLHPREEPPKDSPKKKTVHAKVKINEGKIITVVNPPLPEKHRNENEMEMESIHTYSNDTIINNNSVMITEAANGSNATFTTTTATTTMNHGKEAKKQPHVKIIPRKVGGTTKKM